MADVNADVRTHTYLAVDLRTNEVIDRIPFNSMNFSESKNGINSFSATTPLTTEPHPSDANRITRDTLLPGAVRIVVVRNDGDNALVLANNILWTAATSAIEQNQITFAGGGAVGYLAARRIRTDLSFSGEQFDGVQAILSHAQDSPARDVGLTAVSGGPSGTSRTFKYIAQERRTYKGVLDELAGAEDGFDYLEVAGGSERDGFTSELRIATSLNVERVNVSLELGRNARALSYSEDAYAIENVVDISSQSTTGEAAVFGIASDTVSLDTYLQMDGYERIELEPNQGTAFLAATARQRLFKRATPLRNITVEVENGIGAGSGITADLTNTGIGSIFPVAADYGWLSFEEDFIVEGRSISINDNGEETIALKMTNRF